MPACQVALEHRNALSRRRAVLQRVRSGRHRDVHLAVDPRHFPLPVQQDRRVELAAVFGQHHRHYHVAVIFTRHGRERRLHRPCERQRVHRSHDGFGQYGQVGVAPVLLARLRRHPVHRLPTLPTAFSDPWTAGKDSASPSLRSPSAAAARRGPGRALPLRRQRGYQHHQQCSHIHLFSTCPATPHLARRRPRLRVGYSRF